MTPHGTCGSNSIRRRYISHSWGPINLKKQKKEKKNFFTSRKIMIVNGNKADNKSMTGAEKENDRGWRGTLRFIPLSNGPNERTTHAHASRLQSGGNVNDAGAFIDRRPFWKIRCPEQDTERALGDRQREDNGASQSTRGKKETGK